MKMEDITMEVNEESTAKTKRMTWDERRQLAIDVCNLSPPDVAGVLLLIRNFPSAKLPQIEYPPDPITSWDATTTTDQALPTTLANCVNPIQLQCNFDFDQADPELLWRLRNYVDSCYIPHYVPKENCSVCDGLWSTGHVIACGNDNCSTRVHQECFGMVLRPLDDQHQDGSWLCASCLYGRPLMCCVCLLTGGPLKLIAMTPADAKKEEFEQRWVHVICALAIPELTMRDVPTFEPVDGFDEIENGRFRYLCSICKKRGGASLICEQENCNVGLHPQCAATAGCMIGSESNPLALYCERHVPQSDATRWISEEDLVEEIMSDDSLDAEIEDDPEAKARANEDDNAFILQSTPYLFAKSKLLTTTAILELHQSSKLKRLKASTLASEISKRVPINTTPWDVPGMVVMGLKTQKPLVFPPASSERNRMGVPKFPQGEDLLNAMVDFHVKEQDEWYRARVAEYDATRQLHLLHFVHNDQKGWAVLSTQNTLVLSMPEDQEATLRDAIDGPRVRIYRPIKKGAAEWRPKPRTFA